MDQDDAEAFSTTGFSFTDFPSTGFPSTGFSATDEVTDDRVIVRVAGEVDMSTAEAMFRAATPDAARFATLDLRRVSFFDSAAIHAVVRLAEHYRGAFEVLPSAQVRRVLDIAGLGGQPWLRAD